MNIGWKFMRESGLGVKYFITAHFSCDGHVALMFVRSFFMPHFIIHALTIFAVLKEKFNPLTRDV